MPVNLSQQKPKRGQRALLCGKTGSGKTTLARRLVEFFPFRVVFDTKPSLNIKEWPGYVHFKSFDKMVAADPEKIKKIIFTPSLAFSRDEGAIDEFFRWIYERENTALYIDEAGQVCTRTNIPEHYYGLLTRGREKNITVLSATQRPLDIPPVLKTESELLYVFQLFRFEDRKSLSQSYGISEEILASLKSREYCVWNDGRFSGPYILKI